MSPYKLYVQWKVKLLETSDPKNLEEFCAKYKLTNKDIAGFHQVPTYEEDLRKASLSWLQSRIPKLLHIAVREAENSKSVADIEKLVEIAHQLKKKGETQNNQFNFFNLDEGQNKRIAERYINSTGGATRISSGGR